MKQKHNSNKWKILIFLHLIISLLISACTSNGKNNNEIHESISHDPLLKEKSLNMIEGKNIIQDSINNTNILHCENNLRIWYGGLQSLNPEQIKESYIFGECISGAESFDIIWVWNDTYEEREILGAIKIQELFKKTDFNDQYTKDGFKTLVFKLPLCEVEDILLDSPYSFPCDVKVYHSMDTGNIFIFKGLFTVFTWEEYVQLLYRNIFES